MFRAGLIISLVLIVSSCKKETPAPLPNANFYVSNAGCSSGCWIYFYDQSYSAVSWHWDFGNGVTSDLADDSIYYSDPGFYNVTLQVWNKDNVEDEITKQISVL